MNVTLQGYVLTARNATNPIILFFINLNLSIRFLKVIDA